jgi:hypothetical protein
VRSSIQRVHEDDDEQRRHVAEDLHVGARRAPHEPVVRQAGDAEQGPQDEREDDAQHRHREGVAQAGEDGVAHRVRRAVVGVGDGEARLLVEEAEVEVDVVGPQVVVQVRHQPDDRGQHDHLERDAQGAHVPPQRWP